jgi:hypothetical protein
MDLKTVMPIVKGEFLKHNIVIQECKSIYSDGSMADMAHEVRDLFGNSGTFKTVEIVSMDDAMLFLQGDVRDVVDEAILKLDQDDIDDIEDAFIQENLKLILPEGHKYWGRIPSNTALIFMVQ